MTESKGTEPPKISRRNFLGKTAIAVAGLAIGGIASGCEPVGNETADLTEEDRKTIEEILKKSFVPASENERKILDGMRGMNDFLGQTIESVVKIEYFDKPEVYMVSKTRRSGESSDEDYSIFKKPLLGKIEREVPNSVHFPFLGYPVAKAHVKVVPTGELVGYDVSFLIYRAEDLNPQIGKGNKGEFLAVCQSNKGNDFKEREIFERVK